VDNESLAQTGHQDSEETEVRECRSCYGGGVVTDDVETSFCVYEAVQSTCPICKGSGEVSVFLYAHARRSR
jgi:DnaJ-class molecular chaperone